MYLLPIIRVIKSQFSTNTWKGRIFKYSPYFIFPIFFLYNVYRKRNQHLENNPSRILILAQHKGIGDAILYSPSIRALKKKFPNSRIRIICTKKSSRIVNCFKSVDEVDIFEFKFVKDFKKIKEFKADVIIDFYPGVELYSALIAFLSSSKVLVGFDYGVRGLFFNKRVGGVYFTKDYNTHMADMNLALVNSLFDSPLAVKDVGFEEHYYTEEEFLWAQNLLDKLPKPIIAMQPGASDVQIIDRRWPYEHYHELAKMILNDLKGSVILLGELKDVNFSRMIELDISSNRLLNFCGISSINQDAAIIKNCDLIVCNNSGLLPLSVALNVMSISFSGGLNLSRYSPYLNNIHKIMLNNNSCEINKCYTCPIKGIHCLSPIKPDRVLAEIYKSIRYLVKS